MKSLIITGVGGQGVLLASNVIACAAFTCGFDVKKSEIHGMSQRGGSVFSFVRFGKKVFSPVPQKGKVDILVSFELHEALRWADYLGPDSVVITSTWELKQGGLNGSTFAPEESLDELSGVIKDVIVITPENVKKAAGTDGIALNTVFIGKLSTLLPVDRGAWIKAIEKTVSAETLKKNLASFEVGEKL